MDDAERQLAPHLLADEALVWTGRPDPAKHLGPADVFLVPFSLIWCSFVVFWLTSAVRQGAPVSFVVIGVLFLALGLFFTVGRFAYKAGRNRRTVYGLTAVRALVAVGSGSLAEAPLQRTPIDQRTSRDGRHLTVTFGGAPRGPFGPHYANTGMDFLDQRSGPLAFYDVPDVPGLKAALRGVRR